LTTGWALLAAEAITPGDARIDKVARWLASNRNGDCWAGPSDTAIILLALTNYVATAHELNTDFSATLTLNGAPLQTVRFTPQSVNQPDLLIEVPGTRLAAGSNVITLDKSGGGRLYYSLELRQCVLQPPASLPEPFWKHALHRLASLRQQPAASAASGYRIRRVFMRLTSRRNWLWEDSVPTNESFYNEQEAILVRLIIDCTRPGSRLIIEEPLPPGCRVGEVNSDYEEEWSNWWDYTDVRDDRIVFFVKDMTVGRHEIDYHLNAQTPGVYDIMPALLTSTVDPTLQAIGSSDRIVIDPSANDHF
jgi:hypothetical protein